MKKFFLGIFFIIIISLQGCSLNVSRYINIQENKSGNYHFENLKNQLDNKESFTLEVFDSNLYKTYEIKEEYFNIVPLFMDSVKSTDFIKPINTKENKKEFEIIIKFSNNTYYLNIFNDNVVSIYPYDGYIKSDFLQPKSIPTNYNLHDFCEFIANQKEPL